MTVRSAIAAIFQQEELNFLLTNRIPRRLLTQLVGWFSQIEQPLVRDLSIGVWRFFSGLDLSEARSTQFRSMHDCFIRELKPGARPIDPDPAVMVSPCDAIVGACGTLAGTQLFQIKGFPYRLEDLFADPALVEAHRNGRYVTLRLTSSMYHRFHAPHDCRVTEVTYISGDTWNVNPIALRRIEKLYCKNERAVLRTTLSAGGHIGDPGAGRRRAGRQHPAALPRRSAQLEISRPQRPSLRCFVQQGRPDGLVPARLDHHRVRSRRLLAVRGCRGGRHDPGRRAADAVAVKAVRDGCAALPKKIGRARSAWSKTRP